MARAYREWIQQSDGLAHLELDGVLKALAPHVLDLRGALRPRRADGRADPRLVVQACVEAVQRAGPAGKPLTLNLSGVGGAPWGDAETEALVAGLCESGAAAALGELWVHHTAISDGACEALGRLVGAASQLCELHVSDSGVSAVGLEVLVAAARAGGCGTSGREKLYVNARHLASDAAARVRSDAGDCCIVRLAATHDTGGRGIGRGRGAAPGSGPRGRGGGRPWPRRSRRRPRSRRPCPA